MGNISTHGINVAVFKNLPYDPVKDFAPVSMLGTTPNVLVVHPSVPAKTFKEFIAYAKAHPGTIRYGSSGTGGSPHLAMELLKSLTGTDMLHVPYKGSGPVTIDLMSGQIHTTSASVSSQLPYIKSGKLRPIAVTSARRSSQLPDVPTVIESGVSGYEVTIWYGLFVPAGVPQRIIGRLHAELVKVLATPMLQQRMANAGIDASSSTPAELGAFVKAEIAKWTRSRQDSGHHAPMNATNRQENSAAWQDWNRWLPRPRRSCRNMCSAFRNCWDMYRAPCSSCAARRASSKGWHSLPPRCGIPRARWTRA